MDRKRRYRRRTEPLPDLAVNLKFFREVAGLTQEQLAADSGVSTLGMLESGRRPNSRIDNLKKIARALSLAIGVPVSVGDLRGPRRINPDDTEILKETWDAFLATPHGMGTTPLEQKTLRIRRWEWGPPRKTEHWGYALELLRATQEKKGG